MSVVTSANNEKIKEIKRLRKEGEFYWWEGRKFFEEIVKENTPLELLVVSDGLLNAENIILKIHARQVLTVSEKVFKSLSFTESPQGVGGLIKIPRNALDILKKWDGPIFYLAGVQDPGNVGSIVRIADAFGLSGIIYEKRGASPFNEKAVRASAGSILRVRCVEADREALKMLIKSGNEVFILSPHAEGGVNMAELVSLRKKKTVFVLGQEGRGVDFKIEGAKKIYIPMSGHIDSLNVAITAGIVGFLSAGK